jgi:anti-sigma B factor antagonist
MMEGNSREKATTIELPDRLDSTTSSSIQKTIMDALQPGARVIIDGHRVGYMSAAGVRTLATILHRAEALDADLVFCRFAGAAADCLLVSGFSDLFDIAESTEEAHKRLKSRVLDPAERLHLRQTTG